MPGNLPTEGELDVLITDHAALRYLERVKGIELPRLQDMGRPFERLTLRRIAALRNMTIIGIKTACCPPLAIEALKAGARRYRHPDGSVVVFRNGNAVTVLTGKMRRQGKPKKARKRRKEPRP